MASAGAHGAPAGTTRLSVRAPAPAARTLARAVLGPNRESWLGAPLADQRGVPPGQQRHAIDLEMPLAEGEAPIALRKAAVVDVGPLTEEVSDGPLCILISWRAASLAPLFPVFSGSLCWNDRELRIDGYYAPPGGRVGAAADRIILRLVAQRTARWLISRVSATMTAAPDQSRSSL